MFLKVEYLFNIISLEQAFLTSKNAKQTENKTPVLKMKHSCGPSIPNFPHCTQYKKAVFNEFCVAITPGDNCVMAGGNLGLVKNILCDERSDRKYILFGRFSRLDSLYSSPIEYKDIGVYKAGRLESTDEIICLSEISRKYVLLPMETDWAAMPFLH